MATLPRVTPAKRFYLPLVNVTIDIGEGDSPVGMFGYFRSLTLTLTHDLGARRVWVQDLAGDAAADVTARIEKQGRKLILSGELIQKVGCSAASAGDISNPGSVLALI